MSDYQPTGSAGPLFDEPNSKPDKVRAALGLLAQRLTLSGDAAYVASVYRQAGLEPPALATREATGKD